MEHHIMVLKSLSPPLVSFIKPQFNVSSLSGSCNTANLLPIALEISGVA